MKKMDHAGILGDYRNHWYNEDYLELMASRIGLKKFRNVLDAGCGYFHWYGVLSRYLPRGCNITGVDINQLDQELFDNIRRQENFTRTNLEYLQADVCNLPFDDGVFDLVTCQTLLIHLRDIKKCMTEMYRVLKPGGLVLVSEPNNVCQSVFRDSISVSSRLETRMQFVKEKIRNENVKIKKGNGDNSIGELIPLYLSEAGFKDINCYLNDRVTCLVPPYQTAEQQAKIEMLVNIREKCPFNLSKTELQRINEILQAVKCGQYTGFNPTMLFLSVAVKY